MSLFDEIEQTCSNEVQKSEQKGKKSSSRKKQPGHKNEILDALPHEKVILPMNEAQKICDVCGNERVRVWEELIRSEVEYIPAQLIVKINIKKPMLRKLRFKAIRREYAISTLSDLNCN